MDDSTYGSVSNLIERLKDGDDAAAQELWVHYFERLVRFARSRLDPGQRRITDEEDVALSAMGSLFRGAAAGRFVEMRDRDDLWRILVAMTCRKLVDKLRHEKRAKRGGGLVRGASVFGPADASHVYGLDSVEDPEPTPEFLAEIDEELDRLLQQLPSAPLREVALMRMEGYTNDEIAEKFETSVRSIERKLQIIRETWQNGPA